MGVGAITAGDACGVFVLSFAGRIAREHGVIIRAMSSLYVEAPARSALMLGFSGYPRQTIAPAIARLAQAFEPWVQRVHALWPSCATHRFAMLSG
jgi:hypothetical protein